MKSRHGELQRVPPQNPAAKANIPGAPNTCSDVNTRDPAAATDIPVAPTEIPVAPTEIPAPPTQSALAPNKIPLARLKEFYRDWNIEARLQQHSEHSMRSRIKRMDKFFWFLDTQDYCEVGTPEIKDFFLYLTQAHTWPGGRFGLTSALKPQTIVNYHIIINAFFRYLLSEELIEYDPMRRVKVVKPRLEIKPPISDGDLKKLFAAARQTIRCKRDLAILSMLLDTGLRCGELVSLQRRDFSDESLTIRVLGKGQKFRTVYLSPKTAKAVKTYLRSVESYDCDPLFLSERGLALTTNGLFQLIKRLSKSAGIKCPGVHSFRRTFAVNMRRQSADIFTIQEIMGHSDLTMTRRYTRIADNDAAETHRRCSPMSHLRL